MELVAQTGLTERMEAMYQGLDTPISRELDNRGEDLFGGERQRIAIIRALYKNSPIIVFDQGRVAEIGTFDELIEQKGLYFEFYQKQAQHFTE